MISGSGVLFIIEAHSSRISLEGSMMRRPGIKDSFLHRAQLSHLPSSPALSKPPSLPEGFPAFKIRLAPIPLCWQLCSEGWMKAELGLSAVRVVVRGCEDILLYVSHFVSLWWDLQGEQLQRGAFNLGPWSQSFWFMLLAVWMSWRP